MKALVTGSGGLIGSECVRVLSDRDWSVVGVDNDMRRQFFGPKGSTAGVVDGLRQLPNYRHVHLDIRDRQAVRDLFERVRPELIIHAAAQPSHDRAAAIPYDDFDVNALGTMNLLVAARDFCRDSPFCFTSTNKVYGDRPNFLPLVELETRWDYANGLDGIDETMSIDGCLHSIFGASKVAADVMCQEFGRYFGMPVGIFRGGCLTGPQHAAVELHGYLAYIVLCAITGTEYTIYGYKGKQVRDQIHSADVARLFLEFYENPRPGEVYNLGGGRSNSLSILETIAILRDMGFELKHSYSDAARTGDHICYVSDLTKGQVPFSPLDSRVRRAPDYRPDRDTTVGTAPRTGIGGTGGSGMRVLVLNQFFWPDLSATSQLLTGLVQHLAEEGHEVTVVCGRASYAGPDVTESPDVRILRTFDLPFGRGSAARILSYLTYFAGALWHGLRCPRQDVIVTMTTPPLLSLCGWLIQGARGGRHHIWEMDMYPEVMVDFGLLPAKSWTVRAIGGLARFGRSRADGIISLGECMTQRLLALGVPASKISLAENWADGSRINPPKERPNGGLKLIYTGNMGLGHDIDTLKGAMLEIAPQTGITFDFVGGGVKKDLLEGFCKEQNLTFAAFHSYRSPDALKLLMDQAHIGLVTQIPACTGSIVPSKVYAQMAAGLPILFIGSRSAQPARVIERYRCGWQVEPGDAKGLTDLLALLASSPGEVSRAGKRAHQAFVAHHDKPVAVRVVSSALGVGSDSSSRPADVDSIMSSDLEKLPS